MTPYYKDELTEIYNGDCVEILKALRPETLENVSLCLTDPPYNVGLDYSDGDNRTDYKEWCREWFNLAPRPLVFTPGTVNLAMWYEIEKPLWQCIWHKPNQQSFSSLGGAAMYEPVLVYGKPKKRIKRDVWTHSIGEQYDAGFHPCPKNAGFWTILLKEFAPENGVVLDIFGGSGTTAIACRRLGLNAMLIEKDVLFCEGIKKRLKQQRLF